MKRTFFIFWIMAALCCTQGCRKSDFSMPDAGVGGSLARFTIVGDYLYLANEADLSTFDISDPAKPVFKSRHYVGFQVETIFPLGDKLFLGGQRGMYVFSLAHPASPEKTGAVEHLVSCDPVVANDSMSFVTLRGGTPCGGNLNALYIYDIRQLPQWRTVHTEPMDAPYGLGLSDSTLFVCDSAGIVVFNVADPAAPFRTDTLSDGGEVYYDVIPYGPMLICMVSSGILLYDISDVRQISLVSKVAYQ